MHLPLPLLLRANRWLAVGVAWMLFTVACGAAKAQSAERIALVVGNAAYNSAPLLNPTNDAKAMTALLREAGFQVDSVLDANQQTLRTAVEQFGKHIRDDRIKLAIFYYAGHGVQLDWRNYLIPVDARVRTADDVRKQSVEVSDLLRYMQETKDRSFLVILDACRDNPFAGSYQPLAKGLSQFDAPVGSMIAFSTSPGNVAMDGEGNNGLYTSHLLREFSVRNARIEDAFKRVRLNVRVESAGKQIPWESTSLEDDLYLFPAAKKKLTEAEQEALFEREVKTWLQVKNATQIEPLIAFLREFPSGNTSELAQARLNRILLAQAQARADQDAKSEAARLEQQRQAELKAQEARAQQAKAEAARLEQQRIAEARAQEARAQQAKAEAERLEQQRQAELRAQEQKAEQARAEAERLRQEQQKLEQAQAREREAQQQKEALLQQQAQAEAARLEQQRVAEAKAREEHQRADAQSQNLALVRERETQIQKEVQREQEAQRQKELQLAQERETQHKLDEQRRAAQAEAARLAAAQAQALAAQEAEKSARLAAEANAAALAQAQVLAAQEAERSARLAAEAKAAAQALALAAQEAEKSARLAAEAKAAALAQANAAQLAAAPVKASAAEPVPVASLKVAATPYYKGMDMHMRNYTVGDEYGTRVIDLFNKSEKPLVFKVTAVDLAGDRVEYNDGEYASDLMGNIAKNVRGSMDAPRQFYPSELYLGKKWRTRFRQTRANGQIFTFDYEVKVLAKEKITVPAGTFEAYRLEALGFNLELGASIQRKIWVTPGINADIAHETLVRLRNGKIDQWDRQELVSYKAAASVVAAN